jgi:hypothetical protein
MTTGKPLEQMTEEEEAEYFYANRKEFERNAKAPVSLEREHGLAARKRRRNPVSDTRR